MRDSQKNKIVQIKAQVHDMIRIYSFNANMKIGEFVAVSVMEYIKNHPIEAANITIVPQEVRKTSSHTLAKTKGSKKKSYASDPERAVSSFAPVILENADQGEKIIEVEFTEQAGNYFAANDATSILCAIHHQQEIATYEDYQDINYFDNNDNTIKVKQSGREFIPMNEHASVIAGWIAPRLLSKEILFLLWKVGFSIKYHD